MSTSTAAPGNLTREVPLNVQIQVEPLSGPRIVRDYLAGASGAQEFFAGSPFSLDSFARKWDEVQRRFGPEERALAARALHPTSERARVRLERFVREGGAVVTTGQQAGLLTGPLYTIHKALSVVRLAEALEAHLGICVLPVFWVASEDHDWAEVNHVYLPTEPAGPRRVALSSTDARALPMSERRLDDGVRMVLDQVAQVVGNNGRAYELLRSIRGAYRPGRTVAEAFTELLSELLAPFDLLLTDAADPHLKAASVPVLERALVEAERHEAVLRGRSEKLQRAGYHAQVAVLEGGANLFFHGGGERERLYREGDGFVTRESGQRYSAGELRERLHGEPALFSPNVFLRPVVESRVFPTLAYVAGPGEISYFAQLTALFDEFGIQPPVVYPRFSATLIEPAVQHLLDKLELARAELARPRDELVSRIARRAVPEEVRTAMAELEAQLAGGYRRLIEVAEVVDPTLRGALGALRNESMAHLGEAEHKIVRRVKERAHVSISQLDRARAHLYPNGVAQERVLNVVPYLAKYGPQLLQELSAAMRVSWSSDG